MKKKLLLISVFLFLGLVIVEKRSALAQLVAAAFPRVQYACENTSGSLLALDSDGYSKVKTCPKGTRKVVLGEEAQGVGGTTVVIQPGSTVPMNGDMLFPGTFALAKDGSVWAFLSEVIYGTDGMPTSVSHYWAPTSRSVNSLVTSVSDIVSWSGTENENYFITKNGDIYYWVKIWNGTDYGYTWVKADPLTLK